MKNNRFADNVRTNFLVKIARGAKNRLFSFSVNIEGFSQRSFVKLVSSSRRTKKYIEGPRRIRDFYITLVDEFSKQHDGMIHLIELGNITLDEKDRLLYEQYKSKISALLRANKRMQKKKLASSSSMYLYLNMHIQKNRFQDKYKPAES